MIDLSLSCCVMENCLLLVLEFPVYIVALYRSQEISKISSRCYSCDVHYLSPSKQLACQCARCLLLFDFRFELHRSICPEFSAKIDTLIGNTMYFFCKIHEILERNVSTSLVMYSLWGLKMLFVDFRSQKSYLECQ